MNEIEQNEPKEPEWLAKLRRTKPYAIGLVIGGLLVAAGNGTEIMGKIYDRFKTPEAFVLAENTAKSAFSEQLAQRAWRRLFWADNFRARVVNHALTSDIDASWKAYVGSDADWNANIIISIVGIERYYGAKRSAQLENGIQGLFRQLDEQLAMLRRSDIVTKLRLGSEIGPRQDADIADLAHQIKDISDTLRVRLYGMVRCFSPNNKTQDLCT
jgi:hypothetical protein